MTRYVELHCLSNFSFLDAASHPDELVNRAAELGYAGLAVTDRNTLAGSVRAHVAAKDSSLPFIVGAEIRPVDAAPVVLWVKDRRGYANLCRLITTGRRKAPKGECHLTMDDVASHASGLIAGVLPPPERDDFDVADGRWYRDIFGVDCSLLAQLHCGPHDDDRRDWLQSLSRQLGLPLLASGNVLFHSPERRQLHDVLTAIRHRSTISQVRQYLLRNAERHLRSLERIHETFAGLKDAVARTCDVADQCTFSLGELRYEYPEELAPAGLTPIQHLRTLTWNGAAVRYGRDVPEKIRTLLDHELALIEELHYEPYFLTVWDLVRFARERDILCQGRGSAANSVVCYCLGVTAVDPARVDVLFERFISRERDEAPDIDIDFEHERREEVLQYLYEKYGRDRAGIAAVTITYRPRSAIRDVGKALGLSFDLVDRLAKNADHYRSAEDFVPRCREAGLDVGSAIGTRFVAFVNELLGFPRHLSQHTGGMVMTRGPLHELVPIENAAMEGRTVVQWNKDDLDALGILKVDCLALGMLTAIRKCFELIQQATGHEVTLASIPEGDSRVYDMICRADTIGVFQIESRAQMSMLPRLKPRCYYDLVVEVAIVRPGPILGGIVHPYLRRRCGEEAETYPNDVVKAVLKGTLGVVIFQEQAMRLAIDAAGFTPGESDQLRRAMSSWRHKGSVDRFHQKLCDGMLARGYTLEFAEQLFKQIQGFGSYGFPESHAASFALLVYASAWIKCYHPAAFLVGLLNSQPMGFYAPGSLITDARNHGVDVRPVDVLHSEWDCTLEGDAVRLGFRMIRGLQQSVAHAIVEARKAGPFSTIADVERRSRLSQSHLVRLADADAFAGLHRTRRESLWEAFNAEPRPRQRSLFDPLEAAADPAPLLPGMTPEQEVHADYGAIGFSLKAHPMAFHRENLNRLKILTAKMLSRIANDTPVKVAGIVLLRQRPSTSKGITFVTMEDETGTFNLIVRQGTWERYRRITRHSQAWIVHGRLQSKDSVIHVLVDRLEDMTARLSSLVLKSRDFR